MNQTQDFNVPSTHTVKKESIKAILFDIDVRNSDSEIVPISHLEKSTISLTLRDTNDRNNSLTIFNGDFRELLTAMYTQTTKLAMCYQSRTKGYKIALSFDQTPIETTENVVLEIKTNIKTESFVGSVKVNSSITVETIPSEVPNQYGVVPVFTTSFVGNGERHFDDYLGDDVVSIAIVTDEASDYDDSTLASVQDIELTAAGFSKSSSENVLIQENLDQLQYNPSTKVRNLLAYRNLNNPLDDVRLKVQFSETVNANAKIIWTSFRQV